MLRILFASRLVYEKGVDLLIESIERFHTEPELHDQIEWHICSDGSAVSTIQALAERYPHVHYHGKVDQKKLKELYLSSDILFMPSRFLEIFGLTALEACTYGLPVCGPIKGGLGDFVSPGLELDESRGVDSFRDILINALRNTLPDPVDISGFSTDTWEATLSRIIGNSESILLIHDYEERIGGAEYYLHSLQYSIRKIGKRVTFFGYQGTTTIWKRRLMFVSSLLAFWRYFGMRKVLRNTKPDCIWMHSILRYIGPWGVLAVRQYTSSHHPRLILCHHDLGLLAAFPQDITSESMIPDDTSLGSFMPKNVPILKRYMSIVKWLYVRLLWKILPRETEQMIFSPFLEGKIRSQFGENIQVILFPHRSMIETSSGGGG